jgi:hypothetical protein
MNKAPLFLRFVLVLTGRFLVMVFPAFLKAGY